MVGSGNEAAAQGVPPGQGADHAGVLEITGEDAAGEGGAEGRLKSNDAVICQLSSSLAEQEDRRCRVLPYLRRAEAESLRKV